MRTLQIIAGCSLMVGCQATVGPYVTDIQQTAHGDLLVTKCKTTVTDTGSVAIYDRGSCTQTMLHRTPPVERVVEQTKMLPQPPPPRPLVVTSQSVLQRPFRQCYLNAIPQNPELAGRLQLRTTIGADGTVLTVSSTPAQIDTPDFLVCLIGWTKKLRFKDGSKPHEITIDVSYGDPGAVDQGRLPEEPAPQGT